MAISLFIIIALIMSAVVHEYAHGWMAYRLGDDTAKNAGRLTMNPIKHLDLFGSVLLPLILVISGSSFFIAWAKPVPFNPYLLRDKKYGSMKVAVAGPASNAIMAVIFGLIVRFLPVPMLIKHDLVINLLQDTNSVLAMMSGSFLNSIFVMFLLLCFINIILMVFNLIPIPPLDGSKVIYPFLPTPLKRLFHKIEPFGIWVLIFLIAFGVFSFISILTLYLISFLTGL
ncbi:MAG: site-2 protease family protein [bacterium]